MANPTTMSTDLVQSCAPQSHVPTQPRPVARPAAQRWPIMDEEDLVKRTRIEGRRLLERVCIEGARDHAQQWHERFTQWAEQAKCAAYAAVYRALAARMADDVETLDRKLKGSGV